MDLYCNDNRLLTQVKVAAKFLDRLRGYMFYDSPQVSGIVLKPCNSIHTFFMRFPIDVLFLDHDGKVIKKYSYLEKNKMIHPIKQSKTVVESLGGVFSDVSLGDTISIK